MSDPFQLNADDAPETDEVSATATVEDRLTVLEDFATVVARGSGREVVEVIQHARDNGVLAEADENE